MKRYHVEPFILYMVLVGYNKEQYVFFINFNHMTILLKRGVLMALRFVKCHHADIEKGSLPF